MFLWWDLRRFRQKPGDFWRLRRIVRHGRQAVPHLLKMLRECFNESKELVAQKGALASEVLNALEMIGDPAGKGPLIELLRRARGTLASCCMPRPLPNCSTAARMPRRQTVSFKNCGNSWRRCYDRNQKTQYDSERD